MIKAIIKYTYISALMVLAVTFAISDTAFADFRDTEVFASDAVEAPVPPAPPAPPIPDSDHVTQHSVNEEPQVADVVPQATMFEQWERFGYPNDIGGRYFDSDTGSVGILVVDPTPQRIAELLEMFGNNVIITPSIYTHNELMRVHSEISEMMFSHPDSGICGISTGWTSTDGVVYGFGESGKEFRVTVQVDESVFDHYSLGFMNRYGDRVFVEVVFPDSFRLTGHDSSDSDTVMMVGNNIVPVEITGVFVGNTSIGGNIFENSIFLIWLIIGIALIGIILLIVWRRSISRRR